MGTDPPLPLTAFALTLVAPSSEALGLLDRALDSCGYTGEPVAGRALARRIRAAVPATLQEAGRQLLAAVPSCRAEPIAVEGRARPLRIGEGEHTIGATGDTGRDFAVVRLRVMPGVRGAANQFESEFAGPAEIEALNAAVSRGVSRVEASGIGDWGPLVETRVVFIDGAFHPRRSTPAGFEAAAVAAMLAACKAAGMERLEPTLEFDIEIPRDDVRRRLRELAALGIREVRRSPARDGVRIRLALPASVLLLEDPRVAPLAAAAATATVSGWQPLRGS